MRNVIIEETLSEALPRLRRLLPSTWSADVAAASEGRADATISLKGPGNACPTGRDMCVLSEEQGLMATLLDKPGQRVRPDSVMRRKEANTSLHGLSLCAGPQRTQAFGGEACEHVVVRLMEPGGASRTTSAASCTPVSKLLAWVT